MIISSCFDGTLRITGVRFDACLSLIDSAQAFHWHKEGDSYAAVVSGRAVRLFPQDNGFHLQGVREEDIPFWRAYFDLERDYEALASSLSAWPVAQRAMQALPGLRVLRQPPWETLVSFILSANNNVPRIRGLVRRIAALSPDGGIASPQVLGQTSEATLREMGCGYRAPYLIATARIVRDGFSLENLGRLPYEAAHKELMRLPGVGDKVADCVQLFGLGQSEAFPVDVWMERMMRRYFLPAARDRREIRQRAQEMFGKDAGIIQQSLFHCARLGLISP